MSGTQYILIAEDDALLSLAFADTLEQAGFRTRAVATAAEGLSCAETGEVAAALIDFQLRDGAGGAKLARGLLCRGVPIVICSGYAERYVRERLGAQPGIILPKPVVGARLIEALRAAMAARESA